MFIWFKLGQKRPEMEVRTFARIKSGDESGDEALERRRVLWRSDEKFVENALKYLYCSLVLILSIQNV